MRSGLERPLDGSISEDRAAIYLRGDLDLVCETAVAAVELFAPGSDVVFVNDSQGIVFDLRRIPDAAALASAVVAADPAFEWHEAREGARSFPQAPIEFQAMQRIWYFVLHLPLERQRPGARYEVQLLDRDGRALAEAPYDEETSLSIGGISVPAAVLAAGRAQPPGLGDYVDEHGIRTAPF